MSSIYYPHRSKFYVNNDNRYGYIHICYGQGVGKTSRCIGLAIRAAGAGLNVSWVQFMKGEESSEINILRNTFGVIYNCPGNHSFIFSDKPNTIHFEHARVALCIAREAVDKGVNLLICDEILNTIIFKILDKSQILALINLCRGRTELVMSGVDVDSEIVAEADYVTEFIQRKHPYYYGQSARLGIEY